MLMETMVAHNAHNPRYALAAGVVDSLVAAGVTVLDVGTRSGAADVALKGAVVRKLRERADGLPLEAIVVVSGDGDFASTLRDIRTEGCTAVLVVGPHPKRAMVDDAPIKLFWNAVLEAAAAVPVPAAAPAAAAAPPPDAALHPAAAPPPAADASPPDHADEERD